MVLRYIIILSVLTLSSCTKVEKSRNLSFDITTKRDRNLIPGNVVLSITNKGLLPICIPIAETRLENGLINLDSGVGGRSGPPATNMSTLDIGEGVYIVLPSKQYQIYVHFEQDNGSLREISGVVRAANCRDLFSSDNAHVEKRHFSLKL